MIATYTRRIEALGFIAGCGHSGTTLLANILSTHPDLYVPLYESRAFLVMGFKRLRRLARVRREALDAGRYRIVEKTPRHVHHIPEMRRLFPCARFVLLVRDGRDVTFSIGERFPGDYRAGMLRWLYDNKFVLAERGKSDTLVVRYEDLIEDPAAELGKVCAFLGLGYSDSLLAFQTRQNLWYGETRIEKKSPVEAEHKAYRNWQVNQPIFDGRGRWRDGLPAGIASQFAPGGRASAMMAAFGYL